MALRLTVIEEADRLTVRAPSAGFALPIAEGPEDAPAREMELPAIGDTVAATVSEDPVPAEQLVFQGRQKLSAIRWRLLRLSGGGKEDGEDDEGGDETHGGESDTSDAPGLACTCQAAAR